MLGLWGLLHITNRRQQVAHLLLLPDVARLTHNAT